MLIWIKVSDKRMKKREKRKIRKNDETDRIDME